MRNIDSLKKNAEFQRVYQLRRSCGNKYLVMYVGENGTDRFRMGISVSKKVGNSVVRHRLARILRECYRLHKDEFQKGYDIIVVARPAAKEKGYRELESAYLHLGKMHHILNEEEIPCEERESK